jgi:DNA-binding HxlR family transcriptional regulator
LLIVRDLASGPRRFVELQRVLPGISTEQLRSRLNRMVADGMLTRKRYREVPPRVDYELTERAQELLPVLGALARWGYEWAWSAPRGSEAVDPGAIFRLAPGLLEADGPPRTVDLAISDTGAHYTISVSADGVQVREHSGEVETAPDATVSGAVDAWIAAFSPTRDRDALAVTGDGEVAGEILDGLAATAAAAASHGRRAVA